MTSNSRCLHDHGQASLNRRAPGIGRVDSVRTGLTQLLDPLLGHRVDLIAVGRHITDALAPGPLFAAQVEQRLVVSADHLPPVAK